MKKIVLCIIATLFAGSILSLNAEHPKYRWFKIKYQCEMDRQNGGGFQTHMTTIRVNKNQGQKQAEGLARKEGNNRGCKQGTVTIVTVEEERN